MKATDPVTFRKAPEIAYDIICEKILSGELPPGARLTRRKMAKLTRMSIIPVIEALNRLEEDGLVESFPHHGSQVITLDEETVRDRYALREAVECQVARILTERLSGEEHEELRTLARELDETPNRPEYENRYWDLHYRFHMSLARSTGCSSLVKALHRIGLFTLLQKSEYEKRRVSPDWPRDLHLRVVDEIASRSPVAAEEAMREHILFSGMIRESRVSS